MKAHHLGVMILVGLLAAVPAQARDLKTFNGEVYKNITVSKVDARGIQIAHDDGVIFLDFRSLNEAEQKEFGYDSEKYLAAWTRKRQTDQERRQQTHEAAVARARIAASATPTPAPTQRAATSNYQTTIDVTVESPGFRYGPDDYRGSGFSNVIPPSQGGNVVPYAYPAPYTYPSPYAYPYLAPPNPSGYPYYNGATWGPTIIRRR